MTNLCCLRGAVDVAANAIHDCLICCVRLHIQGVSRLVDIIAGGDFLGLCDQKSSNKHVSDFGRLRSYGHFLIPVHASCEPRLRTSWWLKVCVASIIFAS